MNSQGFHSFTPYVRTQLFKHILISKKKKKNYRNFTYTINLSHSAQIFCPAGRPPVDGGAGRFSGACTCFVTGVTGLNCECEWSSKYES